MFLATDELNQLTGVKRPSAQVAWLRDRGWKFEVNAAGRAVVAKAEADRHMVSGPARKSRNQRPDFSALNKMTRNEWLPEHESAAREE